MEVVKVQSNVQSSHLQVLEKGLDAWVTGSHEVRVCGDSLLLRIREVRRELVRRWAPVVPDD